MTKILGNISRREMLLMAASGAMGLAGFALTGCTSRQSEKARSGESEMAVAPDSSVDANEVKSNDGGLSLDEILKKQDSIFVEHGSAYYLCQCTWCEPSGLIAKSSNKYRYYIYATTDDDPGYSVTLDLSKGDRLLTTDDAKGFFAAKVIEEGYFASETSDASDAMACVKADSEINGHVVGDIDYEKKTKRCVELLKADGYDISYDDEDSCAVSSEPISFNVGQYSGTKYVTNEYRIEDAYCLCLSATDYTGNSGVYRDRFVRMPPQKTKEGYFVIDTSELSPGTWLIGNSDPNTVGYNFTPGAKVVVK